MLITVAPAGDQTRATGLDFRLSTTYIIKVGLYSKAIQVLYYIHNQCTLRDQVCIFHNYEPRLLDLSSKYSTILYLTSTLCTSSFENCVDPKELASDGAS